MIDSLYESISTVAECDGLITTAQRERLESEHKRIGYELQLMRQSDSKSSRAADLADAQSRLASAQTDLAQATEGSTEWKEAESRRRRADSDLYDLQLNAEETVESMKVKVSHLLEIQESILALKNAHLTKLEARKAALIAAG